MSSPPPKREYPGHTDYDAAVKNIDKFVFDPVLSAGTPTKLKDGSGLLCYPGGFANAYKVVCGKKTYALRVWRADIGDAAHHYAAVAAFFKQHLLPCFVQDFNFIPNGILVNGQRFPILRMEWIAGDTLGDFITSHLKDAAMLRRTAAAFLEMVRSLHGKQAAHGDLQAENMIVGVSGQAVWFKLIDYDTLVVPALVGRPISSTGLQCYQHPKRSASTKATAQDDYFAELVIYLCLVALAEDPGLWTEFLPKREKELLFLPEDFAASAPTPVFLRLYQIGGIVRWLTVALWNFTRCPDIGQLQPLEKLIALATEALALKPAGTKPPQESGAFERLLESLKQGGQRGPAGLLPKRWLDDDAFLRVAEPTVPAGRRPANVPGASSKPAGAPSVAPTSPGENFAEKMKRLSSTGHPKVQTSPAAAPTPAPAPVMLPVATPKWVSGRAVAIAAAMVLGVWFLSDRTPTIKSQPEAGSAHGSTVKYPYGGNLPTIKPQPDAGSAPVRQGPWLPRATTSGAALPARGTSGGQAAVENVDGARAGEEREFEISQGLKVVMCWMPAGGFSMGSPLSDADRFGDEEQWHVLIGRGFWLAKQECTQQKWRTVMGINPSNFKGDTLPVENISWNDCQSFIGKLKPPAGGWRFAFPTEAQWEYACRAGTSGPCAGDLDAMAWYGANSNRTTHPVGAKQANAWGLQDMHGNVWEWCADSYAERLRGGTDPAGPTTGATRVLRGGSWYSSGRLCRSAYRSKLTPEYRDLNVGFRLAAVPFKQ